MQIKNDDTETILLNDYAEKAYLEYAMSVVKGRALPSVGDGQKPVQRRILYSMNQMGLQNNARPVKSAKIVGDILSNYHPHGDSTVYEAMVRMSQNFNLRYPLVEGIGNFGSRDGDSAAAMRYTEARLMPISKLLLSEIHEECVDFIDNFDGSKTEPTILPSRLPFVLLNGASGIAVGMATEIPSHNLKEIGLTAIELIKNKNLSIEDMLNIIKGPDFATGGHIINSKEEILNIYKNGKGSIKVRSKYSTEMLTNNNWRIIINEIPPNTSTKKILSQIEELTNPKPKQGKKNISSEVLKNKNLILSILEKIRDESDEKEPIRIVLEPKSKKINITDFINTLFFLTDLETNVQINFVMVGIDSKPKQKNIKNILDEWLEFRKKTITKRISSQIKKINKRIHILEGRIKIFIHIDSIINIIKDSENPKKNIIQKFKLSEEQAEDILEIKLRQLAKLEFIKLETEIKKLTEELTYFNHILENEISRNKLIINEIKSDINKFSDDRRTIIKETKKATIVQNNDDIPLSIILSKQGWIRSKIGHNLDLSKISFKKTDCLNQIIESTSNSSIILLDSNGKCYTINNSDIPNSKIDGAPISSLVNLQSSSQIISIMYGSLNKKFLFSCDNGYGFIVKLSDLISKTKLGKVIIKIPISNKALPALEIKNYEYNNVLIISDEPKIIAFPISQIKYLSKGKGFKLMQLKEKSKIKFIKIINDDKYTLITKNQQNKINKEQLRIIDILNKKGSKGKPVSINEKIIDIE